jgi:hypothetical protein
MTLSRSATFAMEVSRTSMKAARATVAAINHGFDLGFHYVLLSTSAVIHLLPVVFVYLRMTMQTPSH